ncbi:extensin-1-like [Osmia bicornis bicornis]|uniref:extensin-1-like n=1 Tax=Osmia bicornis bicornis TaxID=1437191 RepID=UPI001EAF61BA|nr:extensin-1-like [Osmia bicornis bicornis]XP_046142281.1 extensin-1-like [Osmia bicornis bicornis]XP_046142282.1 extensin-1-like [Osmia bicornis bicornis]
MSIIPLFLILFCSSALTAETETEDAKLNKRGIIGSGGWIGIPNPHSYGHGQPWVASPSWRNFKFPSFDLAHHGLYGGLPYGRAPAIPLPIGRADLVKPVPVYITKHVVVEKPVPIPQPVYIEKPYHVPVEKVIPIPVEKIIHKPVPVPFPVPEAVPVTVERAVPIPVKHPVPVPVPVQQPYPIPVKQAFPVPVPVPYPIPIHPPPISLYGPAALPAAYYARGYGPGHVYPAVHAPSLSAHFLHGYGHGFDHGFGQDFGHGHGHGYAYPPLSYVQDYAHGHGHGHGHEHGHGHGHEHKKRSKN